MDEFVGVFAHGAAERARVKRGSLVRASRARMLTPISSLGATPIMVASERFTRRTLSVSSCTTMKSVMASKISSQWRLACSMRVKRRAFSSAMAAWPAMASSRSRSSRLSGRARPERQSKPASSPLEPGRRTTMQSFQPKSEARSGPSRSAAEPETMVSTCLLAKSARPREALMQHLIGRSVRALTQGCSPGCEIADA